MCCSSTSRKNQQEIERTLNVNVEEKEKQTETFFQIRILNRLGKDCEKFWLFLLVSRRLFGLNDCEICWVALHSSENLVD